MIHNQLTFPELNRPLRSGRKGRQEEILASAGKMRKPKDSPPIDDADSSRQGGAMFSESSFFPAFQNLFLGVPRALSDQRERAVRFFIRGQNNFALPKSVSLFAPQSEPSQAIIS